MTNDRTGEAEPQGQTEHRGRVGLARDSFRFIVFSAPPRSPTVSWRLFLVRGPLGVQSQSTMSCIGQPLPPRDPPPNCGSLGPTFVATDLVVGRSKTNEEILTGVSGERAMFFPQVEAT
jgi:hypothetical protein